MPLNLIKSPRTTVFRTLCHILQRDPILGRAIKPDAFRTWSGAPHDSMEFTVSMAPAIRLTPANGEEHFWSPNAMVGTLLINCDMLVDGTNVDDVQNLWYTIEKAIYPTDNTKSATIVSTLQQAGAHSGLVLFSQPAYDPAPESKFFAAMGQMKIDVRLQFN